MKFKRYAWIIVVLAAIITVINGIQQIDDHEYGGVGRVMGMLIGAFLWPWLIGLIVYGLSRKSWFAGSIGMAIVGALIFVSQSLVLFRVNQSIESRVDMMLTQANSTLPRQADHATTLEKVYIDQNDLIYRYSLEEDTEFDFEASPIYETKKTAMEYFADAKEMEPFRRICLEAELTVRFVYFQSDKEVLNFIVWSPYNL